MGALRRFDSGMSDQGAYASADWNSRPRVLLGGEEPRVLDDLRRISETSGFQVIGTLLEGRDQIDMADVSEADLIVLSAALLGGHLADSMRVLCSRNSALTLLFVGLSAGQNTLDSGAAAAVRMSAVLARESRTNGVSRLTGRQSEVLSLIAEGKTAKQIASALNISVRTAEFHKAKIMDSLNLRTIAELTRYAIRNGVSGE